jgi:hypothetical protein
MAAKRVLRVDGMKGESWRGVVIYEDGGRLYSFGLIKEF